MPACKTLLLAACVASLVASQASAKVQFVKVLPEPGSGQDESIIIKNVGEKPVDLTG